MAARKRDLKAIEKQQGSLAGNKGRKSDLPEIRTVEDGLKLLKEMKMSKFFNPVEKHPESFKSK